MYRHSPGIAAALLIPLLVLPASLSAQQEPTSRVERRVLADGERDEVVLDVPAGRLLEVRALSDEFDTMLELVPPSGGEPLSNDDDGMSTDSRVTTVTSAAGAWRAVVSAYSDGAGEYELRVSVVEPLGVEVIEGRFGPDDLRSPKGDRYRRHQFTVQAPADLLIQVDPNGPIGELIAISPSGERSAPIHGMLSGPAQLRVNDAEAGTWELFALAGRGDPGAYRLHVARTPRAGPAERQVGRLTAEDSVLLRGEYFDRYFIDVANESFLEFELTSGEFDTFLAVLPPSGEWLQDDDGMEQGSRLEVPAEAGRWEVVVTSYAPGVTGQYQLDIRRR